MIYDLLVCTSCNPEQCFTNTHNDNFNVFLGIYGTSIKICTNIGAAKSSNIASVIELQTIEINSNDTNFNYQIT